jgi:hypothetical protein
MAPGAARDRATDAGFGLVEVLVAMILILAAALPLLTVTALSVRRLTASQDQFIASQRAMEAMETVFKARDNRVLTWAQIRNVRGASGSDGGVFLDGGKNVRDPGADGLANTADDGAVAQVIKPGPDGLLGTADDQAVPLFGFTREIEIRDVSTTLRQIRVIVRYRTSTGQGQYVLTTYLSSYA